jgi:hypothetical protein
MESLMDLVGLLERDEAQIVEEASAALKRSSLTHYREDGDAVGRVRMGQLYRLTLASIREHNLVPIMDYMAEIAEQRFHAGYAIREVQTAINVLEEAIWRRIVTEASPDELAEALGLVSTVLGAAKDRLAQAYVSLATKSKAPSLDLSALFDGTASD